MNEYICKSFSDKFESYKLRHELLGDIRYPNDINYAVRDIPNDQAFYRLPMKVNAGDNNLTFGLNFSKHFHFTIIQG